MIGNLLILLCSLLIYAGYGLGGLAWLLAAVAVSYGAGLLTKKYPWVTWVSVGVNALLLTALRLQPVAGVTVLLAPLGISYFTLQLIGYNVDVYRGKYPAEQNFLRYALFITYLPHLFIGPIEGYNPGIFQNRRMSWEKAVDGAIRVMWGFVKKYVIAARVGVVIASISAQPETYRGGFALLAMVLYSVQLYADFSGGMDMVLGLSKMLGITLSENFDAPFLSQTVQEFWRRWHITLGAWLRTYVYIPLGGNRKGKVRKVLNLLITFLVSGLWHGVNYVLWGLFHGLLVATGKALKTRWKTVNRLLTFLLVSLLWAFFVWPDAKTAMAMLLSLFTTFNYGAVAAEIGKLGLALADWIVLGISTAALWVYDWNRERVNGWLGRRCPATKVAVACTLGLLVLVFGMYGMGFNAQAFIYSRF